MLSTFLITGCSEQTATIKIVGSSSMYPVSELLAEKHMASQPGVQIYIQGGDSELGVRSTLNNISELGSISRSLNFAEREKLKEYIIFEDSISIIVNSDNKIDILKLDLVNDIFTGKITNWQQVGGPDQLISVVTREEGSGTHNIFKDLVISDNTDIIRNTTIMTSSGAVSSTVSRDKYAIGYVSSAYLDKGVKSLNLIKDNKPIKLKRPLIYITGPKTNSITKDFLDYATSEEAKKMLNEMLLD